MLKQKVPVAKNDKMAHVFYAFSSKKCCVWLIFEHI